MTYIVFNFQQLIASIRRGIVVKSCKFSADGLIWKGSSQLISNSNPQCVLKPRVTG